MKIEINAVIWVNLSVGDFRDLDGLALIYLIAQLLTKQVKTPIKDLLNQQVSPE